jgi:hypothetical protein
MPSGMAEVIGMPEATKMTKAIVTVGAIGMAEASRMLVAMSISSKKIIRI